MILKTNRFGLRCCCVKHRRSSRRQPWAFVYGV